MITLPCLIRFFFFLCVSEWALRYTGVGVEAQMLGQFGNGHKAPVGRRVLPRKDLSGRQNNQQDTSAFTIVNGRILTPGLGIILSPQPFTPMGGDFLQIAIDVSGDGKLQVPPRNTDDPLTQIFNFTMFLTSTIQNKNFTISNVTTTTPPLANIMNQELSQTVKHVNFEWPACLVGDGKELFNTTARGDYNISIHQNFRLNGSTFYSIFNLPISVTNTISQFPGANQLLTNPQPGPLSTNGGRMDCNMISNPMMSFDQLVKSVNNPPGQPYEDIQIQTTPRKDGGQIGGAGTSNGAGSTTNTNQGAIGKGTTGTSANEGLGAGERSREVRWTNLIVMSVVAMLGAWAC